MPPPTDGVPDDPAPAPDPVPPADAAAPGSGWARPDAPPSSAVPAAGPPPPVPAPPPGPARTNRLAIAALVTGLLGLILLAVGFGVAALVQAGRRGERGKGLAIGGLAASAVWVVVGVVAVTVAVGSVFTVERDEAGHISQSDRVIPSLLRVGDCFTGFSGDIKSSLVTALPCTQPHEGEVAAKLRLPGDTYPGDREVFDQAENACYRRLVDLQKSRYAEHLQLYTIAPSGTTWRTGDREVLCFMHFEGTGKITAPLARTMDPNLKLWYELARGDCLGKWNDEAMAQRTLACTEKHWMEVYAVHTLKAGPFPGQKTAERRAEAGCDERYERIFRGHRAPDLISSLAPERDDWTAGVRTAVCLAESEDRPLKKSMLP
ncbi:DUF4190 domain-containing protein [Actinomadura chokoriensis]|uniref:DUF4190 domain-containing protein n=1 Tax=Actinomadura chokoriensis TaxID=454156 RepID=UPI0031F9FCE7